MMILIPLRVIKTTSTPFVRLLLVKNVAIVGLLKIHFMAKMAPSITFATSKLFLQKTRGY